MKIMKQGRMKDGVLLLLSGLIAAGAAGAFWHYVGKDAFSILTTFVIVTLIVDNRRLRQRLKHLSPDLPQR